VAPRWLRRGIDRRLQGLAAAALLGWLALTAVTSWLATSRVEAALEADRLSWAGRVAERAERAIDTELQRLYHQPGAASVPLPVQLERTVPPLSRLLQEYHQESFRVVLTDAGGRQLAASKDWAEGRGTRVLSSTVPVGRTDWSIRLEQEEARVLGPVLWLRRLLVWSSVVFCALAIVLAWGAAQSIRRPVLRLTSDAKRLAHGDLRHPIAPAGEDEIGDLAHALERMRQALARAFNDVSTMNAELERRVQDRTRELSQLYESLQAQDARRGQLLRKVIAAQEDERKRLARELHDETTQQLTALGLHLDMLARASGEGSPAAGRVREARALVDRMIDELHRVIFDLRPSMLDDLGLLAAIHSYAERRLAPRGIAVRFEFPDVHPDLAPEARTAIFRVVQEALSNIERHAQAETVLVACAVADDRLTIEVEDDGIGFDPSEVQQPRASGRGLGLLGMRERLSLLGGSIDVESEKGQGTRIVVSVPIASELGVETRTDTRDRSSNA
jgi:signal transduction histidine kinase